MLTITLAMTVHDSESTSMSTLAKSVHAQSCAEPRTTILPGVAIQASAQRWEVVGYAWLCIVTIHLRLRRPLRIILYIECGPKGEAAILLLLCLL